MGELIKNRYKLTNIISEGTMNTVWLAIDKKGPKKSDNVIIKMFNKNNMTSDIENIIRFKKEVSLLSELDLRETTKILDMGEYHDNFFIVMEQIDGKTLDKYIESDMTIRKIVSVFLKVLYVIEKIHTKGVLHKDLKPQNILIDENENVKIIDFDFSEALKDSATHDIFEGTIRYSSPEQIGLIRSNIDVRSDLYSLGVIFYEILTKRLPIDGENLNELVYNQISKMPDDPIKYNAKIDDTLARIVLKLLEKDPNKRYFSSKGLIHDLEKYMQGYRDFELGLYDEGVDVTYTSSMIGRDKEVAKIVNMFFDLQKDGGKFILIKGNKGIGKNRLLEEFCYRINKRSTLIINTEDVFVSNEAEYSIIKDILLLIVKEIETYSQDEINNIKKNLKSVLGEYAGLIVDINPIVEKILGKCATVSDLSPQQKQTKTWEVLELFFECISNIKKSLVIFIKKVDLIDDQSKHFFEYFIQRISRYKIMILATTKNEVYDLENIKECIVMKLNPLKQSEIDELVGEVLMCDSDRIDHITDVINKKSRGNPQYTLKVLKQMISQNIILRENGDWIYNENKANDVNISNSFLDMGLGEIIDMTDDELYVLTIFANIGKTVDIDVLSNVLNRKKQDVMPLIDRFYELKLIEKKDDAGNQYSFFNEKVRQVLVERVKERNEKVLHQRIGICLEEKYKDSKEYVLEIYEHFKKAQNKRKMEEYANKVKELNIYTLNSRLALDCFYDVLQIKNDIEYKHMVAKIHYMLGELDIAAKIFEEIYNFVNTTEQKLEVIINLINIYNKKKEYALCEEYINMGLDLLNIELPKSSFRMYMHYLNEATTIFEIKKESNQALANKIGLYIALASYYKEKDSVKSKFFAQRQYNMMKQLKNNKSVKIDAINAFHEYCRNNSKRILDITLSEEEDLQYRYQIAYTYKLYGEYYERKGEYKSAIEQYTKSANLYKSINNDFCYYKIQSKIFDNDYRLSEYQLAMDINQNYSKFVDEKYKDYNIKAYSNFLKIYLAYNDTKNIDEYKKKVQDFIRDNDNIETSLYIDALKVLGLLELEYGTIGSAVNYFKDIMLLKHEDTSMYLYLAEAYIEQLLSNDKYVMLEKNIIVADIQKLLRKARRKCTRVQKGRYYYQKARLCDFLDNKEMANAYYNMSIRILTKLDDKYTLAKVYLSYSDLLKKNADQEGANNALEKAYIIFSEIGARKYIQKIRKDFCKGREDEHEKGSIAKRMKYATQLELILKLNQYVSSILDIDELLQKVLEIAIRYTGAQGGYIFIQNKDTNQLEKRVSQFNDNEVYSRNILQMVQKTGQAILTLDASDDERFTDNRSIIINNLKSVIAVPIKYRGHVKGICYLSNTLASGIFNQTDVDLLESLMSQTAISLENAQLYLMAVTDGLTGLITHKHFRYILGNELERWKRHDRKLSLGMLDIDHFKKFNDTYGHQAGDYVLSEVANIMKKEFRTSDCVARYGGEEFVVILPETDLDGGYAVCERLRQVIEETEFMFGKDTFSVTVSIGVAELGENGNTMDEIIKSADMALYASKEGGRNRVTKAK